MSSYFSYMPGAFPFMHRNKGKTRLSVSACRQPGLAFMPPWRIRVYKPCFRIIWNSHNMNFNDIIKKGEAALAGSDGKVDYKDLQEDAQDAYKTYNSTEGDFTTKAKAVYSGYKNDRDEDAKADSKDEKKEEKD